MSGPPVSASLADLRVALETQRELAHSQGEENAQRLVSAALSTPAPERTLNAIRKLARRRLALGDADIAAIRQMGLASDALSRVAFRRPALVQRALSGPWPAVSRDAFERVSRLAPVGDLAAMQRRLRRLKYRELFRIAWSDVVHGTSTETLGAELSALAQAIVQAACLFSWRQLRQRFGTPADPSFAVLGLGKLGGEDLNFSSDIDLIFLYASDGMTSGGEREPISHAQFFTKLGELIVQLLVPTTADGFGYRVDLNLRPHGRGGPLVLSLAQTLSYYETLGRTWERAALLKARCIAGDEALATQLLESLEPFLWPRSLDLRSVDALRDLKAQIDLRGKATLDDVKLGPGGIREVEFFANSLQLLHGGKNPSLRERNTLRALRRLELAGLLSVTDREALEDAYLFLRRVENRLQMLEERQTQLLPQDDEERARLAVSLGFDGWAVFQAALNRHRDFVKRAFSTLLGQTARDEVPDEPLLAHALDADASEDARRDVLARRGFTEPDRALQALERLAQIADSPFAPGPGNLSGVKLLADVARAADPDQALFHLSEFVARLRAPAGYLSLLAQSPSARRRLVNLFGQSDFLSRYFLGHPELLDALVQSDASDAHKDPERIRSELSQRVHRHEDPEERLAAMRRFKNEEVLRIGLHDISEELTVPEVATQLTTIADGCLDECLFIAESEQRERYGEAMPGRRRVPLAVLAMGKLGGCELGYHSDLDLIFVYGATDADETTGGSRGRLSPHEYFARIVQRLISLLQLPLREGFLYRIDARLRPSGNQGPLVVSERSFREHHEKRAMLWERQALIKARGAAGDTALLERIRRELIDPLVYERPLSPSAAAEIDRLRARMERELADETEDELNPKTGHGGLVDVEFATQYLQLVHGAAHADVRATNTLEAIAALEKSGCLAANDAQTLRDGYLFHRRVENRQRLVSGQSLARLPTRGRALEVLARRLGYRGASAGETFLSEYRAYAARVRDVYARVLRNDPPTRG